ncbi:MAG: cytochrome P460 family protein [Alphaproteobacteria bacterium]|nr:cytochrome P460 family protein [Alphaproteobacteria bacterium]MDE2162811.1 cytochrome P460 family protein [Alphaproteobacteria bacterium]MDE2267083.1 cytochrome P460 family protein [Alphaproteobacteria bacterium]MDE2501209.1 cytochrome P460 family protein [Alphaproteobacteria bacterium]
MRCPRVFSIATIAIAALGIFASAADMPPLDGTPHYDGKGNLIFPSDYRQWVFLSSGLDMSYSPTAPMDGQHMFNNVFVPRVAYEAFLKTGTWPDKTVLMLENRGGAVNKSILKHGEIQTTDVMGLEVHVKDTARFKGGWAFFSYDSNLKPAAEIPETAACYSCHEAHGAVDTTFVQFYPTLMPIARHHKTLSTVYLAETAQK